MNFGILSLVFFSSLESVHLNLEISDSWYLQPRRSRLLSLILTRVSVSQPECCPQTLEAVQMKGYDFCSVGDEQCTKLPELLEAFQRLRMNKNIPVRRGIEYEGNQQSKINKRVKEKRKLTHRQKGCRQFCAALWLSLDYKWIFHWQSQTDRCLSFCCVCCVACPSLNILM